MAQIQIVRINSEGTRLIGANNGFYDMAKTPSGRVKLQWFPPYCNQPIVRTVDDFKAGYHMILTGKFS